MSMRWLDTFSGVGGFALGLSWAGFPPPVAFVEIDEFCQRVLRKHWPDVPIHSDIRELDADAAGPVDLITGGVPCQPASRAGSQRGAADDRWLWPEAFRIVEALRPRWVVFENPPGIYDVGISGILAALEGLGYSNATGEQGEPIIYPLEIGACAAGAPHIRQRVWIVAHADQPDAGPERLQRRRQFGWIGSDQSDCRGQLAHASCSGPQERAGERRDDGTELTAAERNGGLGCWGDTEWLHCAFDDKLRRVKPGVRILVDGLPGRVARLRALGNAVVPQVVAEIGRGIMA